MVRNRTRKPQDEDNGKSGSERSAGAVPGRLQSSRMRAPSPYYGVSIPLISPIVLHLANCCRRRRSTVVTLNMALAAHLVCCIASNWRQSFRKPRDLGQDCTYNSWEAIGSIWMSQARKSWPRRQPALSGALRYGRWLVWSTKGRPSWVGDWYVNTIKFPHV